MPEINLSETRRVKKRGSTGGDSHTVAFCHRARWLPAVVFRIARRGVYKRQETVDSYSAKNEKASFWAAFSHDCPENWPLGPGWERVSRIGTNPELKEPLLCRQSMVDGGRLQSGVEKDSFMDLVCSVVKKKKKKKKSQVEGHR